MDSGGRTFLLRDHGADEGDFAYHVSSAVDDAARVDDPLRPDIDWTIKYLTSDPPRSSAFAVSRRLPLASKWLMSSASAMLWRKKKLLTPMAIQKDSRRAYFRLRSTNRIWQITSFWLFIFSNISAKNYQNRLLSDTVCRSTRSHQIWDVFTGDRTQCYYSTRS